MIVARKGVSHAVMPARLSVRVALRGPLG